MISDHKIENKPDLLPYSSVSVKTGLSIASIRRLVAQGRFPQPVALLSRRRAFPSDEVEHWVAARIAAREAA